jgi:ADP-heptose:LPS heptosyltransferase
MDIAVINLMRFGDLIQCTPVLRRLRAEYPEARISLVASDLFRETAVLLAGVDRLKLFPSGAMAPLLEREGGWPEAFKLLWEWLQESFPRPPDLVINLTPNLQGGILAYSTGSPEIRGMVVNRDWELVSRSLWASYALIVSRARRANPFNLVDLFLREGGLQPDGRGLQVAVPPAARRRVEEFLQGLQLPEGAALVGLMPGASQPERCWSPAQFAQAAQMLLQTRACHFFIFGSAEEAPLGEAIARGLPEGAVTRLLGRTTPDLLAAYLQAIDLLITNDTGPMHLAAAVGTPTVALFLAGARVQDTGPVGPGHVILEAELDCHPCQAPCPGLRCREMITPDAVFWWAGRLLDREPLTPVDEEDPWPGLRVSRSGTDPEGYHTYLPLVRRPLERRDFWLWLQRLTWGRMLNQVDRAGVDIQEWLAWMLCRHYLPPREEVGIPTGKGFLLDLCRSAAQGEKIAGDLIGLADCSREYPVRLLQKVEALRGVDQGLRRLAVAFPELAALVEFFFQEQRDREDTEVVPLARELQGAYAFLRRLGEEALTCLAELTLILGIPAGGGNFPEMARPVQEITVSSQALLPEREGLSCR